MNKLLEEFIDFDNRYQDICSSIKKEIFRILETLGWTDRSIRKYEDIDDFFIDKNILCYNYYAYGESQQGHVPIEYFDIPNDELENYHKKIIQKEKEQREQKLKEQEEMFAKKQEENERKLYEELKKKYEKGEIK